MNFLTTYMTIIRPCVNELFYIFSMILPRFGRFGKDYFHNNNIVFIRGIVKMAFCISLINLLCFLWFSKFSKVFKWVLFDLNNFNVFIMVFKVFKFSKILTKSRTNRPGLENAVLSMILPLKEALNTC